MVADFAFSLLISAHLLSVNLAMMAPLYSIWLERRETRYGDLFAGKCGRSLVRAGIGSMLIGIILGLVALGWLATRGPLAEHSGVAMLTADRWAFIAGELVFALACMVAYLGFWTRLKRWRSIHRLIAVVASTNLLYHFPPLFVMLSVVRDRPEFVGTSYNHAVFLGLWRDGEVLSRIVHHWFASIAVGGVAVAAIAFRLSRPKADARTSLQQNGEPHLVGGQRIAAIGGRVALIASVSQIPVGIWLLSQLPKNDKTALIGGDPIGTGVFAFAIFTALGLMHHLALLGLGQASRKELKGAMATLICTVVLMVFTLQRTRADRLPPEALNPTSQAEIATPP